MTDCDLLFISATHWKTGRRDTVPIQYVRTTTTHLHTRSPTVWGKAPRTFQDAPLHEASTSSALRASLDLLKNFELACPDRVTNCTSEKDPELPCRATETLAFKTPFTH